MFYGYKYAKTFSIPYLIEEFSADNLGQKISSWITQFLKNAILFSMLVFNTSYYINSRKSFNIFFLLILLKKKMFLKIYLQIRNDVNI